MADFKESVVLIPVKEFNKELAKKVAEETREILRRLSSPIEGLLDVIVDKIIEDLRDRRGLKHAFNNIDDDIQQEIRDAWKNIIATELGLARPTASREDPARG